MNNLEKEFLTKKVKLICCLFIFSFFGIGKVLAAVTITKPALAISSCSIYPTAYHLLDDIVIYEPNNGAKANFAVGTNVTLVLSAPANFEFEAGTGYVFYTYGKDITAATINVTSTTLTITYTCPTTNEVDALTIKGLKLRATAASGAINITRTGGTGVIAGLINGTTVTNSLSCTTVGTLTAGATVSSIPNPVCNSSTTILSLSGSTDVASYQWQSSTDNIIFTDITGATSPTYEYTPTSTSSLYFRCTLTCGSTGYSTSALVTSDVCTCSSGDCSAVEVAVDLTSASDTIWSWNSDVRRSGYCCSAPSGEECIKFIINIHPQTEEVSFNVTNPGPNGGAFYKIDCGISHSLTDKVCVNGETSFCITYCKNGADKPIYWISAGRKTSISDDITLRPGCSDTIAAAGFTSVTWTSVAPGGAGQYNSYLSSTVLADVLVTAPNPIPSGLTYVDYQVSGTAAGCASGITTDTVRVFFTEATLTATINPALPAICAGGAPVTLTASGVGGSSPYTYLWSTGATSANISAASAGTYSVTVSDATPCTSVSTSVDVIEFTSVITAEAGPSQTVCSNNPAVTLAGVVGGVTTGIWSGGTGVFTPNNTTLNATYTPSAAEITAGHVTLTLTTTNNRTCPSANDNMIITINPAPVASATPAAQTICSGSAPNIVLSSTVTGTTYAWTVVQSAGITGGSNGSGSTIAQTLSNSGTSNGTATYTITPTANGCSGNPITVVITVKPKPIVTATPASQTICSGSVTNIALTSNVAGSTFAWTVVQSGVTGASNSSGSSIAQTITSSGAVVGTATYTITPTANGCNGLTLDVPITVNPRPVATATPASQTICSEQATNIALSSNVAGSSFTWTVSQGAGITGASVSSGTSIAQSISNSGIAAGTATYTVTPTASGCAGNTLDIIVTVNPLPNATATPASQTICSGNACSITLTSGVAGTSFSWTVSQDAGITGGSANSGALISQTLTNSGTTAANATYTVTPVANSCNGTTTNVVITVNPVPAIVTTSPGSRCGTGTVVLGATSNIGTVYWYAAASGGASLGAGTSYTTASIAATTTYYVDATLNGCTTSSRTAVIATVNTIPTIASTTPGSRCGTGTVSLGATASSGTINWYAASSGGASLGTGTTFTTPSIAVNTTYYVDATANGCTSTSRTAVLATVYAIPTIVTTTPAARCDAGTVTLGATASTGTINWYAASSGGASLGTGTSFTTPSISSSATYYVDATSNGCTTASRTAVLATVNTTPTISGTTPGSRCDAGTVTLGATASAGTVNWYAASSGGASLGAGTNYTTASISSSTTYYVDATLNGCTTGSRTAVIATIYTTPTITATTPGSRCGTGTVSLGATASAGIINWYAAATGGSSLGTGTSFTTPSISVTTNYYVDATSNGCTTTSRTSVTATVYQVPTATATPSSQTICSGGTTSIALTSDVGGSTFAWTVSQSAGITGATANSGATIAQIISNSGTSAGTATYTITPTANGCAGSTTNLVISVNPLPGVIATPASQTICSGNTTAIALSSNVSGTTFAWTVTQGAGITGASANSGITIAQALSNSGTSAGTAIYTVTPTAGGCSGPTTNIVITVNPLPSAIITPASQTICSGGLTNLGLTSNVSGASFAWTVSQGAGISGAAANSGTTIAQTINNAGLSSGTATYSVVSTANGCSGAATNAVVTVRPIPSVTGTPASQTICSGNTSNISLSSGVTGTTFSWTVSQGAGITGGTASSGVTIAQTLSNSGIIAGMATYTVTPTANSCSGPTSDIIITVNPLPTAIATPASQTICSGSVSGIALTSNVAGTSFSWTVSQAAGITGASASNGSTIAQTLSNSGTSAGTATYTVTPTANSCNGTNTSVVITVSPTPSVIATPASQSICSGTATSIALTSNVAGTTFTWTVIQGSGITGATASNGNTIAQTLSNSGTTSGTATYAITPSASSCAGSSTNVVVTVKPIPVVTATPASQAICNGSASSIALTSNVASTSFAWTVTQSGVTGASASSGTNIAQTLSLTGAGAGTSTYSVVPTANSCSGSSVDVVITVNPIPAISGTTPASRCGTGTVILGATSATGTVNWYAASTGGASLGSGVNYTTPSISISTTYYVDATANGCTTASRTSVVATVDQVPTANAGADQIVCANNEIVNLSGIITNSTGCSWSSNGTGLFGDNLQLNTTYTPSALDKTNESVILTLSTTGNGSCAAATDPMTVTITIAPTANAGGNQTVCANAPDVTLSGIVTIATGGSWSGGTGTFNPDNVSLNTTYTPSAAEITAGTVSLTLTTTGNGTCIAVSNTAIITISTGIYVSANTDQTVCANNPIATLAGSVTGATTTGEWTTSGTGSFSDDISLTSTYTPSAADITSGSVILTLTSTNNGLCTAVNDAMNLFFSPSPTVNAGNDKTVCATNATTTLSGIVTTATGGNWITSGTGTFSDANLLNTTYTPSAADTTAHLVTLTLTSTGNGSCIAVTDQMDIIITNGLTADAGPDQTVCAQSPNVVLNGTVPTSGIWTTSGTGTFDPDETTLTATYIPSAADTTAHTVTLTLTSTNNGSCTAANDNLIVTINNGIYVEAGPDQTICSNENTMNVNGSVSGATGGQWISSGTGTFGVSTNLSTTYSPSEDDKTSGLITLTLISTGNGLCDEIRDSLKVTIQPQPIVVAGPDQTKCQNNDTIQLAGSVSGITTTGIWTSDGTGSFVPNNTTLNAQYFPSAGDRSDGSVTLTLTSTINLSCAPANETMTVTITPAVTVDAGNPLSVCSNNRNAILTGSVTGGSTTGQWSTSGSGSFTPDNETLAATYIPSDADTAAGSVTLTLIATNVGSCLSAVDNTVLTITNAPIVSAGIDQTVCANKDSITLAGTVSGGGSTGVWSSSGTGTFSPNATTLNAFYYPSNADTASGNIILTLTSTFNGGCNEVADNMTLLITDAPYTDAGIVQTVCANNPVTSIIGVVSGATITGSWTSSGTGIFGDENLLNTTYTPSVNDISNGSVLLTLSSTGNGLCYASSDTFRITISGSPIVVAGTNQFACSDVPVSLNGSVSGGATTGQWSSSGTGIFDDENSLITNYTFSSADTAAGSVNITLTSTNNGNCNAVTNSFTITIEDKPVVSAGPDQVACRNNDIISLNGSVSGITTTGEWTTTGSGTFNPDEFTLNATYTPSEADRDLGTVMLTLTSTNNSNCTAADDAMQITITPAVVISSGGDQSKCANNPNVTLIGSVSGGSNSGIWTSSGTGTFNPNNTTLITNYIPSNADTAAGSVTLTLTATNFGTCLPAHEDMILTITNAPYVNAGVDATVCSNNDTLALAGVVYGGTYTGEWISDGTGSFIPDAATLNANYIPSGSDTALGNVTLILISTNNNECIAVSDTIHLTITDAPHVNAGIDQTVCANNAIVNLSGEVSGATATGKWTSSGNGTFDDDQLLTATYTPGLLDISNGEVMHILTSTGNGTCYPKTDTVKITITPTPVVDAGEDHAVCSINNVILTGSVSAGSTSGSWSSSGTGTFENSNSLSTTYYPSSADTSLGTISLILTSTNNNNCIAVTDAATITFDKNPNVSAQMDQTVCAFNDTVSISGTVSGITNSGIWTSTGDGTFIPGNTSLSAIYVPGSVDRSTGLTTLTLTSTNNSACVAISDFVTITITPSVVVNAGSDQTVCANNSVASINGNVTGGSTTGVWSSSGTGTFGDVNSFITTYTPSNADTAAGTVYLILSGTNIGTCLPASDTVALTISDIPIVYAGIDQTVCANNDTISLNGIVSAGSSSGIWISSGSGNFIPNTTTLTADYIPSNADTASGTIDIYLVSTNNGGCLAVQDTLTVTISNAPYVFAGTDQSLCANNADVSISGIAYGASSEGIWTSTGTGSFSNDHQLSTSYTPDNTDISSGFVKLVLTSDNIGTCIPVSDTVFVEFTPAPLVQAGPDIMACSNNSVGLNGSVSVSSTTGQWTGDGTGTFSPNADALNATYIPSSIDTANGTVNLVLTSTNNGNCNAETSSMAIQFVSSPTIEAGLNETVCAMNDTIDLNAILTGTIQYGLWTTSGTGTFIPADSLLTTMYIPSNSDRTAGTVTVTVMSTHNPYCTPVSDSLVVTITPPVSVNAGIDQSVCANDPNAIISGTVSGGSTSGVWSTDGSGTFSPSETDLNCTYIPSNVDTADGSITLTLTSTNNGNCLLASDQMILTISNAPVVLAGMDQSVCANNDTVQLTGIVSAGSQSGQWTTSGSGTFVTSDTSLAGQYIPSTNDTATGTVTLVLTSTNNGACIAVTDTIVITITDAPFVFAGTDTTICGSENGISISGIVSGGSNTGSWSTPASGIFDSNLNSSYTFSSADTSQHSVSILLTSTNNGNCIPVVDTMNVIITPRIYVNAGNDRTICATNSTISINGSVTGGTSTGQWTSTGSGTFTNQNLLTTTYHVTPADTTAGIIYLILTSTNNGLCNEVIDSMKVTINPGIYVNAGPDQITCANNVNINLTGSVSGISGTGAWSTSGQGGFNPNSTTLQTQYLPDPADVTAGIVTFVLTSTNNGGCSAVKDTMILTITPSPIVDAGDDLFICKNNPVATISASISAGSTTGIWTTTGTGQITPFDTSLNILYTPSTQDTTAGSVVLYLASTNNGDCIAGHDTITITYTEPPVVFAGNDTNICASNPLQLNGSIQFGAGTGFWESTGNGTFVPNASALNSVYLFSSNDISSGVIRLILKATNVTGCNLVTDTIQVSIYPGPTVDAGSDITVCANNSSVQLSGIVSGSTTTGVWSSSGTGVFTPDTTDLNAVYIPSNSDTSAGSVKLYFNSTNNAGCNMVQDSLLVTITESPVVNAGQDQIVCKGLTVSLNGLVSGATTTGIWTSSGGGLFSPSDTNLTVTYTPSTTDTSFSFVNLFLTSTNNGNCNAVMDMVSVQLVPLPIINAGSDITTCANNISVNLSGSVISFTSTGQWSTTGSGVFSPNTTSMNTSYIPSVGDISTGSVNIVLSSTNTCVYTDTVHLTIIPEPTVSAGPDQIVCINQTTIQLDGSVTGGTVTGKWTTSGSGTFVPNDTVINATYIRSAQDSISGQISFWLTSTNNGNCFAVSDDMVLTFTTIPVVEAGQNFTFCANNANISLHGSVTGGASTGIWTTSGSGTFSPNATTLLATYLPGTQDLDNGSVALTLTSTGSCVILQDSVIYTFTPVPVVDAGTDITVCANNANISVIGVVSGITTTGHWYSNGTGTFTPNATTLNASYNPTADDISAGIIELTLASTNNGMCYPTVDTVLVTVTPAPVVNAGNDSYVCKGNNVYLNGTVSGGATTGLWTTTGTGTFNPNNATLNATYIPSPADTVTGIVSFILTSTDNGSCIAISDNRLITFTSKPIVEAGESYTVCANNSSVTLSGSVSGSSSTGQWTSSGNGTFTPAASSLNAAYTPGSNDLNAGSAILYLSSTNACVVSDSLTLTITNAPSVNAGEDQFYCVNNPVVPLNGIIGSGASSGQWTTSGTGTFVPSDTLLSTTYIPSYSDTLLGSIVLTLTSTNNGSCLEVKDSLVVHFIEYPVVEAGPDTTYCGNCYVILDGSIQGGFTSGNWTTPGTGQFDPNETLLYTTYHFSSTDTTQSSLEFTLSSPDYDGCPAVTDSLTVSISPAPHAIASEDVTVCANNNTVNLSGTITGPTSTGIWITSGSGTFIPNDSSLTATYIPSEADNASGEVLIFLRSTHNGICFYDQDTVVVTILPAPEVNAGADQFVCNGSNVNLPGLISGATTTGIWTTTGTGTFSPNATTLNAVYIPSGNDSIVGTIQYILTATNIGICLAESDTMFVSFTAEPFVEAGSDNIVCANNGTLLLNGIVSGSSNTGRWLTSGNGVFLPDSTALNAQYVPGSFDIASGQATLTLESTNACLIKDSLVVSITPAPIVNAGPDRIVCYENNSIQISASVTGGATTGIWSTTGSGTFTPGNTSLNVTYHTTAQDSIDGVFYLILTSTNNGNCLAEDDSVRISFSTIPNVSVGPDVVACANTNVSLQGNVTGGNNTGQWTTSGSGTFTPSDTSFNATYIFSYADTTAGNISLQFTATNACVAATDTVFVTITPAPSIISWVENSVCANNPTIQLNSSVLVANGLVWSSTSGGAFVPNDSALMPQYTLSADDINTGSVTYILTSTGNGDCNPTIDTMIININPQPVVNAGPDKLVCFENLLVLLDGIITGGASTGIWTTNGSGTFVPNDSTLNAVYMPSSSDTAGGYLQFILTSTHNGNCFSVSDTMLVTFTERPIVTVTDTINVCEGITAVNISGNVSGVTTTGIWSSLGEGEFSPSDTSLNAVYSFSQLDSLNGFATLILTSTNGCIPVTDTTYVIFRSNPVAGFSPTLNCNSLSVLFTDTTTIETGSISVYDWNFGDSFIDSIQNPTHLFAAVDSFDVRLTVTSAFGCIDSVVNKVTLYSVAAEFTNDANCLYDSVQFTSISGSQNCNIISTTWSFGDNSTVTADDPSHLYQESNTYYVSLIVNADNGCSDTIEHSIIVNPVPVADFYWDKQNPSSFENITFIDSSKGANYWSWDFGDQSASSTDQNPVHMYNDLGIYNVMLITENNFSCYDTLVKEFIVEGTLGPLLPAAFSPNNDGMNDYLKVRGGPFKTFAFIIYNEWGKVVYQSSNPLESWDGKYNGKDQTNGVYVYIIKAEMYDGTVYNLHGDITLIR